MLNLSSEADLGTDDGTVSDPMNVSIGFTSGVQNAQALSTTILVSGFSVVESLLAFNRRLTEQRVFDGKGIGVVFR